LEDRPLVPHLINLMGKRGNPGAAAAGAIEWPGARPEGGNGAAIARAGDGVKGQVAAVLGREMVICDFAETDRCMIHWRETEISKVAGVRPFMK